jgi:uncharacterized protein YegL
MTNTTEIALILDQSGSMESIKAGTLEGVNAFLQQQKAENDKFPVRLSLTLFSTESEIRLSSVPVIDIPELNDATYRPSGGTALLDAIGSTIDSLGKRLADLPEDQRPETVIVAIMTDGEENSSRVFNWLQISDQIKHQSEVYKWQFLFLGANQDAIATAARMNIDRENSVTYFQRDGSSRSALKAMASSVSFSKSVRERPSWSKKKSLTELYAEEEANPDSGK